VALEREGEIIMGGVHGPFQGERFYAEKGGGASLNGKKIEVSETERLADSLMVTGFPYDRRENIEHYLEYMRRFLLRAQGVLRVGAAALDLCYIACGRLDGFWEEKLHPWDTAAGKLIVEEAGGRMSDFEGMAFSPYGKQMVASNGLIHDEILSVIRSEG
jgi:myo-inositol-1(or 4)-monophosphatase